MSEPIDSQINEHEARLQRAMLQSDVNALDQLLAPGLIFTNHLGHVMSKQEDIEAHRSGMLKINELTLSDTQIQSIGDVAVVTTQVHLAGSYAGNESEADFRFTRVWARCSEDLWHFIVGHSCVVAET